MIKISIYRNHNNECVGFRTIGHAGAGEYGQDIVCSAVSILVINTINSIEAFTDADLVCDAGEEEGMIDFRIESKPTKETELLMNSMILGLQSMEDSSEYSEYLDIIFEEV